ncbi:MAG: hypothetical protein H6727_20580 [Myxococcales bacterium]|nr:hypothetical protein [Myxococcales bacterium]
MSTSSTPPPRSVIQRPGNSRPRNVKKVPYVELYGGRLQGVVSSGSDIERVYVSFVEVGTGNFYCSTNNNRPCSGLGWGTCKHIDEMAEQAILQYGGGEVARYLGAKVDSADPSWWEIHSALSGSKTKAQAAEVFSRFLNYLHYLELPRHNGPAPEMTWFTSR